MAPPKWLVEIISPPPPPSPSSGPIYMHTAELWALHWASSRGPPLVLPSRTNWQPSPLPPVIWAAALQRHPDRHFAEYIVRGLEEGFRIGFKAEASLQSASRNMSTAYTTPHVVSGYLDTECSLGRVIGPLSSPPVSRPGWYAPLKLFCHTWPCEALNQDPSLSLHQGIF